MAGAYPATFGLASENEDLQERKGQTSKGGEGLLLKGLNKDRTRSKSQDLPLEGQTIARSTLGGGAAAGPAAAPRVGTGGGTSDLRAFLKGEPGAGRAAAPRAESLVSRDQPRRSTSLERLDSTPRWVLDVSPVCYRLVSGREATWTSPTSDGT